MQVDRRSRVRKGQEPAGVRGPPAAGRLHSPGSAGKGGPGRGWGVPSQHTSTAPHCGRGTALMGNQPCPGIHSPSFATEKPGPRGSHVKTSVQQITQESALLTGKAGAVQSLAISDKAHMPVSAWTPIQGSLRLASEGDGVYTAEAGGWIWARAPEA